MNTQDLIRQGLAAFDDETTAIVPARKPQEISPAVRSYAAATLSRLTNDWVSSPIAIDQDIRMVIRIVRERARDLEIGRASCRERV